MNLMRAVSAIGGMTMLSRVFGFVRDMMVANYLGAGWAADCFVVAFRFPNLFRRLFAEGAFSAAFVPLFSRAHEGDGDAAAREFAEHAFTVLALVLVVFVAVVEIAMPWLMPYLAPGFEGVPGKMELATEYTRIAFPYLLFISLVSLQSGVLNALGRFAAAAAAPVLLNIVLIASLLLFGGDQPQSGRALSWGVFAAGVAQFLWLVHHCRKAGFPIRFRAPKLTERVRRLGKRILPVVFGASLYQINLLIGTILATMVGDGAVSYLYYADRVVQLPLGVVGIAVGTALLPMISRHLEAGRDAEAHDAQNRGAEFALLLTLPAAVALAAIAEPIISVLFQRGAFDAHVTQATAVALMAYAAGLPAYVAIRVFTPGFFAREDTVTPVRIAAVGMIANIVLNVALMGPLGHVGIALAATLSAWLNALALIALLAKRGHYETDARFRRRGLGIAAACALLGAALVGGERVLAGMLSDGQITRIATLVILVAGGALVYGAGARLFGGVTLSELKAAFRRAPAAKAAPGPSEPPPNGS